MTLFQHSITLNPSPSPTQDVWMVPILRLLLGVEGDRERESIEASLLSVRHHGLSYNHPILYRFRNAESANVVARRVHLAFVPSLPHNHLSCRQECAKVGDIDRHVGVH